MSYYGSPAKTTEPGAIAHLIRLTGNGAAAPTVTIGSKHVTVTRNGVGDYTLTWIEKPGAFCNLGGPSLQADTPADIKNCSVTPGAYVPATKSLQVLVWSSAGAARELAAAEYINLTAWFKRA